MDDRATASSSPARAPRRPGRNAGTGTLDLALRILEHLAHRSRDASLGAIAKEFLASKATVYRHLGVDTNVHYQDGSGRPVAVLPGGKPIDELCE